MRYYNYYKNEMLKKFIWLKATDLEAKKNSYIRTDRREQNYE